MAALYYKMRTCGHTEAEHVEFRIVTLPNGQVKEVIPIVEGNNVGTMRCAMGVLLGHRFLQVKERLEFELLFDFAAREEMRGRLSRASVLMTMRKIRPDVDSCSEGYSTVVEVGITISSNGSVETAEPLGEHENSSIGHCVATAIKKAVFPQSKLATIIRFPFRLQP